jgi:dienelactone hydrolase
MLRLLASSIIGMATWQTVRCSFATVLLALALPAVAAEAPTKDIAAGIEVLPVSSMTLSDEQFLKGDDNGKPVTIAGVLRIAQGMGRLPLVIFIQGSAGFESNIDLWDRQFQEMGISTFALDGFAARGISRTTVDQSQLGMLNEILDLYRALAVLGVHPRVDPTRIAVMGFSRGGIVALYSSLRRFQKTWNTSGVEPAAYMPFYPACIATYIDDTNVSDRPIRIFQGELDDFTQIAPCRAYAGRLQAAGKNAIIVGYPDTWHDFDSPLIPPMPYTVENAQAPFCVLREETMGVVINSETMKPFTWQDRCVGRNAHIAYSAASTHAAEQAVKMLLKAVFELN